VRASMGSIFGRPPARATFEELQSNALVLDHRADQPLATVHVDPPVTLCVGGERTGLPEGLAATARARIPLRGDGPDSLNAAVSAAIGLYRMAADA
jgi:tRNA G18 (ribose-2'-O)-methylase SpoU